MINLRPILIAECTLELIRVRLECEWLGNLGSLSIDLGSKASLSLYLTLMILLPGTYHTVTNLFHTSD